MRLFALAAAFALAAPAFAQPTAPAPRSARTDPAALSAAQHDAMAKLAMMDGVWRGTAWSMTPSGRHDVVHTERVGPFLGGFLLLIATTVMSGYWTETNIAEVENIFVVLFSTLQYTYLFGILPAMAIAAIDDILCHIRKINPTVRMLIVGVIAFAAAELLYGSRGPDSGVTQFILYGLVGLAPAMLSSWLAQERKAA